MKAILSKLARNKPFNNILFFCLSVVPSLTYVVGLYRPFYHSQKFFIQSETVSLLDSIELLYNGEEYYLAGIIFTFTVAFPVAKNVTLLLLSINPLNREFKKLTPLFKVLSRWSMLDVFIVAVLLLNMNLASGLQQMKIMDGLVYFSVSVILSTLAFWHLEIFECQPDKT